MQKKYILTKLVIYLISTQLIPLMHGMCIPCGVTPVVGSPYTAGIVNTYQVAFSPDSKWLAVANFGSDTVSIFSVNADTCQLMLIGTFPTGGSNPLMAAYSPDGSCLAVSNFVTSDISIFSVNQITGAITLIGAPVPSGGFQPIGIAYSPNGTCLAVANEFDTVPFTGTGNVSIFTVNTATCAITMLGTVITGILNPITVDYSPNNRCLAVTNFDVSGGPGTVSIFSVDPVTCSITSIGAPVNTGDFQPTSVAYSPNGSCLAVTNSALLGTGSGSVSIFSVDSTTCSITQIGSPIATGGNKPIDLSYSPDGNCLAVVNTFSDTMMLFHVNTETCEITPTNLIATGSFPIGVSYSPDNHCLAVANSGVNPLGVLPLPGPTGSVSIFKTTFTFAEQSPIVQAILAKYCSVCFI